MFQPELQAANAGPNMGAAPTARRSWRWILAREGIGIGTDRSIDLGDDIGSRAWWLGLAGCLSLIGAALALATLVPALPTNIRPDLTPAQRENTLPQIIAPLARGGMTGALPLPNMRLVEPLADIPERPRLELTTTLNGRDTFESALRRAGVGRDDIAAVTALVRPAANLTALPKGTAIDVVLGRRDTKSVPRPLELIGFRAAFDLRLAVARADGALQLRRIPIAVDHTPLRVQGLVGANLQRSLRSTGLPDKVIAAATAALGYAIDFQHGIGKRDRFDVIVEQDKAETGDVRQGDLLYVALRRDGKEDVELARYSLGGHPEFFRANGESAKKGLMRTPVDGAHLTSGFGMRFHPLLAYTRMHQGVDFGAPSGSPIMAAAGGTIAFVGPHGGHGNYVMVRHTAELSTGYAHMSRFAVKPGQRVSQGQVIGYVGSTGISTGPHLHYEIWLRGKAVNPVQLKFIGGTQLAGADMARFRAIIGGLRGLLVTGGAAAVTPLERKRRR